MKTLLREDEQFAQRIEEPEFQVPLFTNEEYTENELFDESLDDL